MLVDFFLEQQRKILELQQAEVTLEILKKSCQKLRSYNTRKISLLKSMAQGFSPVFFPCYICDEEFRVLFGISQHQKKEVVLPTNVLSCVANTYEDMFALFASPLSEFWKSYLVQKRTGAYSIKFGFFQCEYSIYLALSEGFQAITLFTQGLDRYQIQYFTEVGRDAQIDVIFLVQTQQQMLEFLESDAPYMAFLAYEPSSFQVNHTLLSQCAHLIPTHELKMSFVPYESKERIRIYVGLGFDFLCYFIK